MIPDPDCPRCALLASQEDTARRNAEAAENQAARNAAALNDVLRLCERDVLIRTAVIRKVITDRS